MNKIISFANSCRSHDFNKMVKISSPEQFVPMFACLYINNHNQLCSEHIGGERSFEFYVDVGDRNLYNNSGYIKNSDKEEIKLKIKQSLLSDVSYYGFDTDFKRSWPDYACVNVGKPNLKNNRIYLPGYLGYKGLTDNKALPIVTTSGGYNKIVEYRIVNNNNYHFFCTAVKAKHLKLIRCAFVFEKSIVIPYSDIVVYADFSIMTSKEKQECAEVLQNGKIRDVKVDQKFLREFIGTSNIDNSNKDIDTILNKFKCEQGVKETGVLDLIGNES
ncbi:MAG: hypothetical protein MUE72_09740 [Chitinophagaceae bacterium]|nr:hypothetical protein [Chitinophagaceae bacterium]